MDGGDCGNPVEVVGNRSAKCAELGKCFRFGQLAMGGSAGALIDQEMLPSNSRGFAAMTNAIAAANKEKFERLEMN